ncbi:MAG: TIGR00282 family metallophosphoesterase [bacterium]
MLKILVLGDIMGSIGRKALAKKLPTLRKKYAADLVIANCENLAHGSGVTAKTLREIFAAGVDFCTSGNHIWDKKEELKKVLADKELANKIIRPANYKKIYRKLGEGYKIIEAGGVKILIINLAGRVLMKNEGAKVQSPIIALERILEETKKKKPDVILIDFHTEATSEKRALGWFADGKASLIWGTHTHTPTADFQIQPQGAGYITDLGMTGARDAVIGENKEMVIKSLIHKDSKLKHDIPEHGWAVIQGICAEIDGMKTKKIKQILEEVNIK